MKAISDVQDVVNLLTQTRGAVSVRRSVLMAVTGIDGCGKGYLTTQILNILRSMRLRVAAITVDGWLNLPHVRFDASNPAGRFYESAIRFDEMFTQLVLPLRDQRSLRLVADYTEETAGANRRHVYDFEDIDVIVLEGIYLLKRAFQPYYDLSCWIDCSFATALERAIARAQEGLSPHDTTHAYRSIYFPAQEIHFQRDNPRSAATLVVNNDVRFDESAPGSFAGTS